MSDVTERLEALRTAIEAENISWGEIAELQSLAQEIEPGDVQLLQWAGVPESQAYVAKGERDLEADDEANGDRFMTAQLTDQGTAASETALCNWHIAYAADLPRLSYDEATNPDRVRVDGNPELHCQHCGWPEDGDPEPPSLVPDVDEFDPERDDPREWDATGRGADL